MVYYMGTLALAALDGVWSFQLYFGRDAEYALELRCEFLLQCVDGSRCIENTSKVFLTDFHLYLQCVEIVDTIDNEHIAWCELGHAEYDAFHL